MQMLKPKNRRGIKEVSLLDNESHFNLDHSINPEENNFMEISDSPDNEDVDDSIEYIEYNEEDDFNEYVVIEDDDAIAEKLGFKSLARGDTKSVHDQIPSGSTSVQNNDADDLYHCSSCNTNFYSVTDHINEFHKDQSVFFDELDNHADNDQVDEQCFKSESETKESRIIDAAGDDTLAGDLDVKSEQLDDEDIVEYFTINEFLKQENMEVAEVEYIDETESGSRIQVEEHQQEEIYFDSNGRPYIRKKVKNENRNLLEINTKTVAQQSVSNNVKKEPESSHLGEQDVVSDLWFLCPECDKKFQTERKLANHMRFHHKVQGYIKIKPRKITEEQVVCQICNTIFPSNKSYRLHSRMHGPVKVRPIEEAIGYEMKSSMKDGKQTNETFYCDICKKSYDITFQEIHVKSHKIEQTYMCTTCNKKFANEISLSMHLKAHQENPKVKPPTKAELNGTTLPHECNYCGRQFARPHEKVKHERIHTGEKPYKCEICGKSFRVAYCLTLHLRTHTAARPYVCPHCNKRYKAYSGYNHHLMTHSDERPYKCPHCPKAFKTSVQLAGHKNSHTKPFTCPDCNRPFASLYAVKAHMETHKRSSQTLKHECAVCGAIYARAFALKDHMKEQHQNICTEGDERAELNISEVPFLNETETILPDNVGEITIDEMDHFQTEEVVTDWLK